MWCCDFNVGFFLKRVVIPYWDQQDFNHLLLWTDCARPSANAQRWWQTNASAQKTGLSHNVPTQMAGEKKLVWTSTVAKQHEVTNAIPEDTHSSVCGHPNSVATIASKHFHGNAI
jgi:hypothetical protein